MRHGLFHLIFSTALMLASIVQAQDYLIRPQFDAAGHFHDGIAPVYQDGKWGFVDVRGNWMVRPQFDRVIAGAHRRFGVQRGGKWGYIDTSGALVIPHRYAEAGPFSDGVAAVSTDGRVFTQIDPGGRDLQPDMGFDRLYTSRDGLAILQDSYGNWTGIRPGDPSPMRSAYLTRNEIVVGRGERVEIEELTSFREQLGFARIDGMFTLIWFADFENFVFLAPDMTRDVADAPRFADVRWFSDGLAAASPDGARWGFIDKMGNYVIPPRYEGAREFSQGVAPVQVGDKWGYIDRTGQIVFQSRYDRAYSFAEGFATVRDGDLRGFLQIGSGGDIRVLHAPQFEDVFRFQEGIAPVKSSGQWGFIAAPGAEILALRPIERTEPVRKLRP
jgi:hypothetical protein